MKIHPRVGAEILRNVAFGVPVSELVLAHHERWDGLGYPAGIRGDDIPIGAEIWPSPIATARSRRRARIARRGAKARDSVLRDYAGSAFDPALVELFIARLADDRPAGRDERDRWTMPGSSARASSRSRTSPARIARNRPLRNRPGAGLEPRRRRCDGVDSGQGEPPRAVRHLRAVPRRRRGRLRMPLRAWAGTEALFKWEPRSWSDLALRLPSWPTGAARMAKTWPRCCPAR